MRPRGPKRCPRGPTRTTRGIGPGPRGLLSEGFSQQRI